MTDVDSARRVEFGRVVLHSWEHDWETSSVRSDTSLRMARRILPEEVTHRVYTLLKRQEARFLRNSLPFPPYDFRVRPEGGPSIPLLGGEEQATDDLIWMYLPLANICDDWEKALRDAGLEQDGEPLTKRDKYGRTLRVAGAQTTLREAYSLDWQRIAAPQSIDDILGKLSPRRKPPGSPFWASVDELRSSSSAQAPLASGSSDDVTR